MIFDHKLALLHEHIIKHIHAKSKLPLGKPLISLFD